MRLQATSIVIIGGTSGLGLSAAQAFVQAGAHVVVTGRNPDKVRHAQSVLGASAQAMVADAADPQSAPRAIELARRSYGRFDGLYHVAGGSGRSEGDGPLHALTDSGWHYTLQENLTALFYSNRAAVQVLLEQGQGGSILNMGSVLGFAPSPKHFSTHAYATTKAAIIGLTRSAAAYYAPHNIRFNVIAPALVATPMSERAQSNTDILAFIRTKQPLDGGRISQPSDLDSAAIFFMSKESSLVTGQVLAVDGGWCVSEGQYAHD